MAISDLFGQVPGQKSLKVCPKIARVWAKHGKSNIHESCERVFSLVKVDLDCKEESDLWHLSKSLRAITTTITVSRSRDVPVSGRHGDTVQLGTARSDTVPTRPDTVRHGPAWRGLRWLMEVTGLANRSEGSGQ